MRRLLCKRGNTLRIWEVFLIGVGLSMDAFAVSICKGLQMRRLHFGRLALIALFFGGFQGLMPFFGWLLGSAFAQAIARIDHWIAFALLFFIGAKMIYDAVSEEEEEGEKTDPPLPLKELFMLAVATSIDALAVGVTFSFLQVDIIRSALLIGATTFVISAAGVLIGFFTGGRFRDKAQIFGGAILIALGIRILATHLMGV